MTTVFTTIFGGSDSLKPAPAGADLRCVCFTDTEHQDAKGWEIVRVQVGGDPRRAAWRTRCRAHELFPASSTTVWVDASFTVTNLLRLLKHSAGAPVSALRHHARTTCYQEGVQLVRNGQASPDEIAAQLAAYRVAGFSPSHLSISCVIVRDASPQAQRFNETWLAEIERWPGDNTQVSLDYSAWRHGLEIRRLKGTRHDNPYAVHDHADHKRRRRPYR